MSSEDDERLAGLRALLLQGPPACVVTDCRIDRAAGPYEECGHGEARLHARPGGPVTAGLLVARGRGRGPGTARRRVHHQRVPAVRLARLTA